MWSLTWPWQSDFILRGACARTGNTVARLDVSSRVDSEVSHATVLRVAAANTATLREIDVRTPGTSATVAYVVALLRAAPKLRRVHADLNCGVHGGTNALLHGATRAFARAARIYSLSCFADDEHLEYDDADVTFTLNKIIVALRSLRLVAHGTLTSLNVHNLAMCYSPAFSSLAHSIVAARLTNFRLSECYMNTDSGAGLVHLTTHSYLERFEIDGGFDSENAVFDAATGPAFGAALMSNTRLRVLVLENVCLWKVPEVGAAVLAGAIGHPTLRELSVAHNECHHLNLEASTPGERAATVAMIRE